MTRKDKLHRQRLSALGLVLGGIVLLVLAFVSWRILSPKSSGANTPISRLTTRDFHSLAYSLSEPETIYFGHYNGLLVSRDGGHTWQPTTLGNVDAMALALPPANPQVMYAAGHNVFFKSTDAGVRWQSVNTNLPGLDIHGFAANPANADLVYAHVVGFGLWRSADGGVIWTMISPMPPSTFNLAFGDTAQTLYAAAGGAGLLKSVDGGVNWSRLANLPGQGAIAVAFDSAHQRLYTTVLGDGAGLFVSTDGGAAWSALGVKGQLLALAVSPHNPDWLVAVNDGGEVYASQDRA